jgi:predicted NAD/FAD-binding protein
MRIAIVGAGVSGLVAAHLLHERHEIAVFEADARPGGHANTVRVDLADETHRVDTGFVVYNDRNYPLFERLLDRLGVATQPADMSFGVSDERGRFEYASTSPNAVFARRANLVSPSFVRMLGRCRASSARRARCCAPTTIRHSPSGSSGGRSRARSSSG